MALKYVLIWKRNQGQQFISMTHRSDFFQYRVPTLREDFYCESTVGKSIKGLQEIPLHRQKINWLKIKDWKIIIERLFFCV